MMLQTFSTSAINAHLTKALSRLKWFLTLSCLMALVFSCKDDEPIGSKPTYSLMSQLALSYPAADVWGYEHQGKEYAIIGSSATVAEEWNVSIVDVTDPSSPSLISVINPGGVDIKAWSHYLYIAQGNNTFGEQRSQIVDISDPQAPVIVGSFPAVHNVFIDDAGFLYVTGYFSDLTNPNATSLNVSIYDLKPDPTKPTLVWSAPSDEVEGNPAHDISVIRNRLYVFNHHRSRVEIFDVTDRASPAFLGKYQFSGENVHSGWVTEDNRYLFVCLEDEAQEEDVVILDISNPAAPFKVGAIHDQNHTVHNLYVIGEYAYVAFYGAGLRIYNVSKPRLPQLVYAYDTNGSAKDLGAFGIYPFSTSGNIYISDVQNGLFLFKQND